MRRLLLLLVLPLAWTLTAAAQREKGHGPWDVFLVPKAGACYSNFTSLDGKYKLGAVGGIGIQVYVLPRLAVDVDVSYSHEGSHDYKNPASGDLNDARLEMINTTYLLRGYPIRSMRWLSIYTGMHVSRVVGASVNTFDKKDDIMRGDVAIPAGLGVEVGPVSLDARFQYSLRKVAKSDLARKNLGDARLMAVWVTLGYKFQIF